MRSKMVSLLIIALVFVAGYLGYMIIVRLSKPSSPATPSTQSATGVTPPASSSETSEADAQKALAFPGDGSTQEERTAHANFVNSIAIESDTLDVTDCKPSPVVIKLKSGTSFTIKNTGASEISVTFAQNTISVSSKSEKSVNLTDFIGENIGHNGYSCKNSQGISPFGVAGIISTAGF